MHCRHHTPSRSFPLSSIAVLSLLAGCQAQGPRPLGPDVPPPPQFMELVHKCTAADSRFALGQKVTPELLQEARDRTGARTAVAVKSGEIPSPADPLRLILEVDGDGKMVGARCG